MSLSILLWTLAHWCSIQFIDCLWRMLAATFVPALSFVGLCRPLVFHELWCWYLSCIFSILCYVMLPAHCHCLPMSIDNILLASHFSETSISYYSYILWPEPDQLLIFCSVPVWVSHISMNSTIPVSDWIIWHSSTLFSTWLDFFKYFRLFYWTCYVIPHRTPCVGCETDEICWKIFVPSMPKKRSSQSAPTRVHFIKRRSHHKPAFIYIASLSIHSTMVQSLSSDTVYLPRLIIGSILGQIRTTPCSRLGTKICPKHKAVPGYPEPLSQNQNDTL